MVGVPVCVLSWNVMSVVEVTCAPCESVTGVAGAGVVFLCGSSVPAWGPGPESCGKKEVCSQK